MLQPVGGMDMIVQGFLRQVGDLVEGAIGNQVAKNLVEERDEFGGAQRASHPQRPQRSEAPILCCMRPAGWRAVSSWATTSS